MLRDSYQTRGLSFAFLIGPPRNLERQIGMAIHAAICEALGLDDIGFKYQPGDTQPGGEKTFSKSLTHEDGPRHLAIQVDHQAHGQPVRLLLTCEWPTSNKLIFDDFTESVLLPFLDHFRPTQ